MHFENANFKVRGNFERSMKKCMCFALWTAIETSIKHFMNLTNIQSK